LQKKVLVFDLDNTLIHRDQAMLDCIESLFKIPLSKEQKKEIAFWDEQGHSHRIIFCQRLKEILTLRQEAIIIWNLIRSNIGFHVRIEKEVQSVLEELKKTFELVILTNGGTENQRRKIEQAQLTDFFTEDEIFISEMIGFDKPDPRAFQFVRDKFAPGTQFCMIGDHWEKDILGALKFGWQAIYLNSKEKKQFYENVIEISNIPELIRLTNDFRIVG